nr:immunoglobulin heavy chain junction region [Macaca mulatta]MPN71421.1 immunoglobulin heavy chain junction region [Macaca mulatta]MPN72024.1 immunoglobulin heavy chain junction region [Macaca mulatta]MPN72930.1 immunoglobulin heavy chain junction region [Macaca mulatta]MPN74119.1 immunoglobulin heavy chain junction region [Macaca mulatta]
CARMLWLLQGGLDCW